MPARRCEHPTNVGFGDRATGEIDIRYEAITAKTAAGHRYNNGFELQASHAFGNIDGLTDHLLGLHQIDYRAGFHAACRGMRKGKETHAVAAPSKNILWRLRLQARDQANDFAGADVKAGNNGRALRRNRLHLRGKAEAQHGHASPPLPALPFFAFSASLKACSRAAAAPS